MQKNVKLCNPWFNYGSINYKGVYYFLWKRKEENDCIWTYNCTVDPTKGPSTEGGYASEEALLKAKGII